MRSQRDGELGNRGQGLRLLRGNIWDNKHARYVALEKKREPSHQVQNSPLARRSWLDLHVHSYAHTLTKAWQPNSGPLQESDSCLTPDPLLQSLNYPLPLSECMYVYMYTF